ncbi:hypothetical protein PINS_up020929 [Pythium insidiosum]|nr:hypothetical protein PINS_up013049 [Pythium insidiosum]GLE09320.1 hypothetical protein PINS_up020929 [Pythium insidiosum]
MKTGSVFGPAAPLRPPPRPPSRASLLLPPPPPSAPVTSRWKRKPKRVRKKSPLERERAAERARDDSLLYNLTLDVHELRQQLHDLHVRRQALETRARLAQRLVPLSLSLSPSPSPLALTLPFGSSAHVSNPVAARGILGTACEYLRLMHDGLSPGDRDPVEFITARTAEVLSLGVTGLGRDALMEQWRRYTTYFGAEAFVLRSTTLVLRDADEEDDDDECHRWRGQQGVVRCVVQLRGRFTPRGLMAVFPAAWRDPALRLRLLGRRLECDLLFHLYFDADGRIMRHDVETDFLGGLQRALDGDSCAAARIMEHAVVGEEAMVASLAEDDEQQLQQEYSEPRPRPGHAAQVWQPKRVRHSIASLCAAVEELDDGGADVCAPVSPMSSPHACEELYDDDVDNAASALVSAVDDPDPRHAVTFLLS